MRGMILAAGRGKRMGSLTDHTPKPLLRIGGQYLIEYAIRAFIKNGIYEIVINTSYLGDQIKKALGNGEQYGATIYYSEEVEALETGGGVYQALPLLGEDPFIVLSGDIITDYALQQLPARLSGLAHIVLVDNPPFHPQGDFFLEDQLVLDMGEPKLTFANIGIYRPELFADFKPGKFRLAEVLRQAMTKCQVTGEYFKGLWHNLGSPRELNDLTAVPDNLLATLLS